MFYAVKLRYRATIHKRTAKPEGGPAGSAFAGQTDITFGLLQARESQAGTKPPGNEGTNWNAYYPIIDQEV